MKLQKFWKKRDYIIIAFFALFIAIFSAQELSREISLHGIDSSKITLIILGALITSLFTFSWLYWAFRRSGYRLRDFRKVLIECSKIPKSSVTKTEKERTIHNLCSHIIYSIFLFFAIIIGFAEYVIVERVDSFLYDVFIMLFKIVLFIFILILLLGIFKKFKKLLTLGIALILFGITILLFQADFLVFYFSGIIITFGVILIIINKYNLLKQN
ncbi:MAG: hypothetical protein QFX40_02330 [Archaeoglobales archaeon]|nr:hypothetical protein [Archaeoglobales archaeon]